MIYHAKADKIDTELSVEREVLRIGKRFLDFADVRAITPLNHRVLIDTLTDERLEISMLGFSYDGFFEELWGCFCERSLEAMFVEEEAIMTCEGEFETPFEKGRAKIRLYPDAVCILPCSCHSVRIPLCFTDEIRSNGYMMELKTRTGARYTVGRMGYDTHPFFERTQHAADRIKKERAKYTAALKISAPFTQAGLFRTMTPELSFQAAYGESRCAVELFTGDDAATYLYRFTEDQAVFSMKLEEAMEAISTHRELIYLSEEQIQQKPLYRMSVQRCEAVQYLRAHADGRLIHSQNHAQKLKEYLG